MSLDSRYPAPADLRRAARRRIPHFMWEYLDSATGSEAVVRRNRAALDAVLFLPAVLGGAIEPDLATRFLGRDYALPLGIAPVGMSGAIWPGAESVLARLAVRRNLPFCLSTMATRAPEDLRADAGTQGWFQLYPPGQPEILADMLDRIRTGGFHTLVITVDVPRASRRERQSRGGLTHPPKITPRTLAQIMARPAWALGTLRHGMPGMPFVAKYSSQKGPLPSTEHIGYLLRIPPDWAYLARLRDQWEGALIVKGILSAEDALGCRDAGADAVWISNHAGRQFDGAPAALDSVAPIRSAVGDDYPLIYDSGIEGGLDILRALALGADFVMLGKAFHWALAALGARGGDHLVNILQEDLLANMGQLGLKHPKQAARRLLRTPDQTA